jgi:hypothetical protein
MILDFGFWIESIEARAHRQPQEVARVKDCRLNSKAAIALATHRVV